MSTLYDISQRYMAIEALLDDESVPQEDINAALAEIKDELQVKGENIIAYLQKMQDVEEQAKRRKKDIDNYLKAIVIRRKRLEKAVIYSMDNMQVKSILTNKGEMKVKKNPPSVVIDDLTQIPTQYQRQKIQVDIDKVAIKAAIKAGEEVPGAHLEQGTSLSY
jgi:Holliday junction resolvase RusA-like endonuclease